MNSDGQTSQRKSEWLEGADWNLHEKQFASPYRINEMFFDWLAAERAINAGASKSILDVGAGMGASLFHLSKRFPGNRYLGVDLNPDCITRGMEKLAALGAAGCELQEADLFDFPESFRGIFDGVISLATLSWLPGFEPAARCLMDLKPEWIAATSLFCPGSVDAIIATRDYSLPLPGQEYTEKFYNVYSLDRVRAYFSKNGYGDFMCKRFEIDIDLPQPSHGGMGTYTEHLADGRRMQISGPVLMNWHFILAKKTR